MWSRLEWGGAKEGCGVVIVQGGMLWMTKKTAGKIGGVKSQLCNKLNTTEETASRGGGKKKKKQWSPNTKTGFLT